MVEVKHVHTLAPEVLELLAGFLGGGSPAKKSPVLKKSVKKVEDDDDQDDDSDADDDQGDNDVDEPTKDDCRELAGTLKEKGKGPKVMQLLGTFGVKSITNLPDKKVKAFYDKLKLVK